MGHLKDNSVTWWQHWKFAAQFALVMILVGLAVLVHAFFPFLFQHTGSQAIRAMVEVLDEEDL